MREPVLIGLGAVCGSIVGNTTDGGLSAFLLAFALGAAAWVLVLIFDHVREAA